MVFVGFVVGLLVGIAVAVGVALLLERAGRSQRFVATSLIRNPRLAYRLWFDPKYKAVIRDMRKMLGS